MAHLCEGSLRGNRSNSPLCSQAGNSGRSLPGNRRGCLPVRPEYNGVDCVLHHLQSSSVSCTGHRADGDSECRVHTDPVCAGVNPHRCLQRWSAGGAVASPRKMGTAPPSARTRGTVPIFGSGNPLPVPARAVAKGVCPSGARGPSQR